MKLPDIPRWWRAIRPDAGHDRIRSCEKSIENHAPSALIVSGQPVQELSAPGGSRLAVASCMELLNGFPVMHWGAIDQWLAIVSDPEARRLARLQSRRGWLTHLRDALGPHFALFESEQAFVLSSLDSTVAAATADYVRSTRRKVAQVLGRLAEFPPGEKSVLLVLDDEESYYRYVSIYYPEEGEFAFSGGMFINAGCPHFVVRRAELSAIEPIIAHELTHSALSHFPLPRWLDEGIAVNTERNIAFRGNGTNTPQQMHAMHLRFWNAQTIQEFWSGDSFLRTDDGTMLSYDLARIMVEHMSKSWDRFEEFVMNATREDSGSASAKAHLGIDLGFYVCALIERNPAKRWSPRVSEKSSGFE